MEISTLTANANASASSTGAFSQLTNNFDTFLTLLTTQLRNQNPLEPLDTEKFTEQLVQFASVEQSIQTNANLEALISLQSTSERDSAIGFVGKVVGVDNPTASSGGDGATWTYELPRNAETTLITITDSTGEIAARRRGATTAGEHHVRWNGLTDDGALAAPGEYTLSVKATTAVGEALAAPIQSQAMVTGVVFDKDGPRLETSGGLISLDAVKRVLAGK